MRTQFDAQLSQLSREMLQMGGLCEQAIAVAAKALLTGDPSLATQAQPLEQSIDKKEREIESLCLRLLLCQQPVAGDLRQISAALKMITDLERIGDQAADIAEIVGFLGVRRALALEKLSEMARMAIGMVTDGVRAFARMDTDLAQTVIQRDDEVDHLFCAMKRALIDQIARSPEEGEYALDLLMIAKYLERIGDHAVNVAEWAIFAATGVHKGISEL